LSLQHFFYLQIEANWELKVKLNCCTLVTSSYCICNVNIDLYNELKIVTKVILLGHKKHHLLDSISKHFQRNPQALPKVPFIIIFLGISISHLLCTIPHFCISQKLARPCRQFQLKFKSKNSINMFHKFQTICNFTFDLKVRKK
jgi:hypothetical protein